MAGKDMLTSTNRAFSEVRAWKTVSLLLTVVSLFLSWQLTRVVTNQPVVLVPHNFATEKGRVQVSVNGEIRGTSAEYLANMALSDIALITNFTPENVMTTYNRFLNRLTDPLFASQETPLLADAKRHKERGMTQSFFPTGVKTTLDGTQMEVTGTLVQSMAGKEVTRLRVTYLISYQVFKGQMQVSDLRLKEK